MLVGPYVRRDGFFCFAGRTRGELGETEEDWERWKDSPADMAGWDKKEPGLAYKERRSKNQTRAGHEKVSQFMIHHHKMMPYHI